MLLTAYSDIDAAIKAINEAHLDHYLSKPWDPPEECLFPVIDDLLDAWQAEYLPEAKGLRLVGHQWSPRSHAIKDFLAGNLIPYRWLDVARNPDTQSLLDAAGIGPDELPALFFEDGSALRNPEPRQVAERLGRSLSAALDLYDLVIVGAGPAGLAAAVYGASEGLRTLLLDRHAPGGQAGSSSQDRELSRVSGRRQRQRADAARRDAGAAAGRGDARAARSDRRVHRRGIQAPDAQRRPARSSRGRMLAATGMEYREHPAPGVAEHTGAGVYYGAATTEAPAFSGRRVLVVGGGNSAGQAAMYLARYAKDVQIVVRRDSLRDTMSQYLIDQIEKTPNIRLRSADGARARRRERPRRACRAQAGRRHEPGGGRRRGVRLHRHQAAQRLAVPPACCATPRDSSSRAGICPRTPRYARIWKERREPMPLETSVPGVFAAGDIRAGAMNRVASAVGEGSMVVRFVHEYLALT